MYVRSHKNYKCDIYIFTCFLNCYAYTAQWEGRDSSAGTATRYGLDGPGIESWWRQDLPHPSRPALEPTHPPIQRVPSLSRG
jgi:hypothetical protein